MEAFFNKYGTHGWALVLKRALTDGDRSQELVEAAVEIVEELETALHTLWMAQEIGKEEGE